jgi:hypothetical protein
MDTLLEYHNLEYAVILFYKIFDQLDIIVNSYEFKQKSDTLLNKDIKTYNSIKYLLNKKTITNVNLELIEKYGKIIDMYINKFPIDEKNAIAQFGTINKMFRRHLYSMHLYSFIITSIINKLYTANQHNVIYTITTAIEQDKNEFLLLDDVDIINKSVYANNPPFLTFGLSPITSNMSLHSILKYIYPNTNKSSFEVVSKEKSITFIILNRIIKNPMSYNIFKLIDFKKASHLIQSDKEGINSKTVDRSDIISYIDSDKTLNKWDFDTKIIGPLCNEKFIVLQALAINNYCILSNGGMFVKKQDIYRLLYFINNKLTKKTRVSKYHEIMTGEILLHLFSKRKLNMETMEERSHIIDIKYARNEIFITIVGIFDKLYDIMFDQGINMKSDFNLSQIVHHKDLRYVFSDIITRKYMEYLKSYENNENKFPISENIMSFMSHLSTVDKLFIRDLHDVFIKLQIDQDIYNLSLVKKKISILNIFKNMLEYLLSKNIRNDDNIYKTHAYKTKLLNSSVL